MSRWSVESEVGRLRAVMVHQPGLEHRRTVPWNKDALLFDDVLDIEEARPEHKQFSMLLASHGAQVLFLADLLKDVCRDRGARECVYLEVLGEEVLGRFDAKDIHPYQLISGLPEYTASADTYRVEPLPNLYFSRDAAFGVPGAVVISHPFWPARQREARLVSSIFRRHPAFAGSTVYEGILNDPSATVEGGDVQVVDPQTVLVGVGERTNDAGADRLAAFLFENTSVRRVLKLHIPANRVFMHLDTILTFVDRQQVLTMPYLWEKPGLYADVARLAARQCRDLRFEYRGPSPDMLGQPSRLEVVTPDGAGASFDNALEGLAAIGVIDPSRTVLVAGDPSEHSSPIEHVIAALREQWNDGANAFALKPGQVMGYTCNDRTGRALERAGVEVVTFKGSELVRGRGGARCMTMPLHREAA
ncbi:MAG: arginine deiminase [Acidobacteria bacterium]|nr:arginine deiminase [Acidobacteriota bacterium]